MEYLVLSVNQLTHSDRKEWNTELIRQIFHNFDAKEIVRIAIPRSDVEDYIAWHYERNGVFSVRITYKLVASLKTDAVQNPSSSSSEAQDQSIWDVIWKEKVPPKVTTFGWRSPCKKRINLGGPLTWMLLATFAIVARRMSSMLVWSAQKVEP